MDNWWDEVIGVWDLRTDQQRKDGLPGEEFHLRRDGTAYWRLLDGSEKPMQGTTTIGNVEQWAAANEYERIEWAVEG